MTTSPQAYRPDDLAARAMVAAGGAFLILVLAVIGFGVSDSWLPGVLALLLIPVHVVLAITDTNLLEDPKNAGARAVVELRRLAGGGVVGSGFTSTGGAPGSPVHQSSSGRASDSWGPAPAPGSTGAGGWPDAPGWESTPSGHPARTGESASPSPRIPLGPDRGFEPPGPGRPSTLYGFGSYGARDHQPRPATAPVDPPVGERDETTEPERHHDDDDPDMTIQRPPKNP